MGDRLKGEDVAKLSIRDVDLSDRGVLVRVDFNVPTEAGRVLDDTRIRASLPTIEYILEHGGRPVLISHLGRPKGEPSGDLSLKPVADVLDELIAEDVVFAPDCVGDTARTAVRAQRSGQILLLENLRFHAGEEANDPVFAKQFSELGEVFINDAFGTAHRAHASTEGVAHYFATCASGLLMQKELDYLGGALADPETPFVAVLGGKKVSGKIDVITNLLDRVSVLLIGGGMAYTFFKVMGLEIGRSLLEEDRMGVAEDVLREVDERGVDLLLPDDCVCTEELSEAAHTMVVDRNSIPPDREAADIGPKTRERFREKIVSAKTVVWNGPMGVFELAPFAEGTKAVVEALASATGAGATTVVGGGETASAVVSGGMSDRISHVSTGGGASLEFLEGKALPGVEALSDREEGVKTRE